MSTGNSTFNHAFDYIVVIINYGLTSCEDLAIALLQPSLNFRLYNLVENFESFRPLTGVSRLFLMGFPSVRIYRIIFGISSDQLLTI